MSAAPAGDGSGFLRRLPFLLIGRLSFQSTVASGSLFTTEVSSKNDVTTVGFALPVGAFDQEGASGLR